MSKIPLWLRYLLVFIATFIIVSIIYTILANTTNIEEIFGGNPYKEESPESKAGEFTAYDAEGNAVKLSDFRGKPVILNFWASWCGPCKAEMPEFETAYQTYGDQVQFLVVNLTDGSSETVETASGYIAEQGYTFPVYYDTAMEAAVAYRIYAIPVSYFIDASGEVRATHEGMIPGEALTSNIEALLAQ